MARARTRDEVITTDEPTAASLLRWSSVIGGVVLGGALLILLSTLWMALAVGTGAEAIADGIGWYLAGSAIVALFVGGLLAGALSGVPGITAGIFNGLAVWGLILMLSAVIGVPAFDTFAPAGTELPALQPGEALWPAFWSLLIGAVTAAIGGAIGGMMTRGATMPVRHEEIDYDESERATAPAGPGERFERDRAGDVRRTDAVEPRPGPDHRRGPADRGPGERRV